MPRKPKKISAAEEAANAQALPTDDKKYKYVLEVELTHADGAEQIMTIQTDKWWTDEMKDTLERRALNENIGDYSTHIVKVAFRPQRIAFS